MSIAKYIDHTILKQDARKEDIERITAEAREYGFASVCVNSCWVKLCHSLLEGTDVKVCTVVGFPLGAASSEAKKAETAAAVADGADEIDMVLNVGYLKSGMLKEVYEDIVAVRKACREKALKVIIETCLLTDDEKIEACHIAERAGADFVKTSTGFSTGGAAVEDIVLMHDAVGGRIKVKASGGIRTLVDAEAMIRAGASRIGASAGVSIVKEEDGRN